MWKMEVSSSSTTFVEVGVKKGTKHISMSLRAAATAILDPRFFMAASTVHGKRLKGI